MIYLDHAATTPIHPEVVDFAVKSLRDDWYNPNGLYSSSKEMRRKIDNARDTIANCIGAKSNEIIFCPSSSAANSLAILGYLKKNKVKNFVTSRLEHDSILNIEMPIHVRREFVECDSYGNISPSLLSQEQYSNSLVSIQGANNEIGTIQDLKELSKVVHENNSIIHSDLTQYIPHIKVNVRQLGLDMATFSAHKLGGLRGCAVLYVRDGIELAPLVYGNQEKGLMAGTENTLSILCMAKAMQLLDYTSERNICSISNFAINRLTSINNVYLVGAKENRLCSNANICFRGVDAQALVYYLDLHGICCSTGSACNSLTYKPSHVLKTIGMSDEDALCCIRFTFGEENTYEEVNELCHHISNYIKIIKSM